MITDEEKRKKRKEYRNKSQINFVIPKKEREKFNDLMEFVFKNTDYKYKDIFYFGLIDIQNRFEDSHNKYEFKVKEKTKTVDLLRKKLLQEEELLNQYKEEEKEFNESIQQRQRKNFATDKAYEKEINKILKENPDELTITILRKFITENIKLIDKVYSESHYKNEKIEANKEFKDVQTRINTYVQIFNDYYKRS